MNVEVIRSRRKTLALQVSDKGKVIVRAPYYVSADTIRHFVECHLDWIEKQQIKIADAAERNSKTRMLSEADLADLKNKAREDFVNRVAYYAPRVGVTYGRICIRQQKSKWGSCSSKGNLNFNCLLMLAPEEVRNYVVVHELCHRKQMNHSQMFWAEVERILPDYRDSRLWLKRHGQELLLNTRQ